MILLRQPAVVFCLVAIVVAAIAGVVSPEKPSILGVGEQRVRGVIAARVCAIGHRSPGGWTFEVELGRLDRRTFVERPRLRLFVPNEHLPRDSLQNASRAAATPPAQPGDRLEVFARIERYPKKAFPGRQSARVMMAGRGIDARATAVEPIVVDRTPPGGFGVLGGVERGLARGRAAFEGRLLAGLPDQQGALAVALTTGNRSFLDPSTADPFRVTGTAHLLAISGLHLGVLAALLWWLFGVVVNCAPWLLRRFGRRRVCAAAVIVSLGCYVVAIGAPVSAVRAWVAIACGATALMLMRPLCPFHALATAAIGMIMVSPAVIAELGFQLSFAATLGILLFLRFRPNVLDGPDDPFAEPELGWRGRLSLLVGVSTSATLATWPITAAHFGQVSLSGLVVNLIVTPLVSAFVFPVLVAGAMLTLLVEPLGFWLLSASTEALLAIGEVLSVIARLPGALWITGATPLWATLALAAGALVAITSRWRPRRLVVACAAILVGLSAGLFDLPHEHDGELHVHFIPVGQGDATLVGFPDGTTMLVDGGGRRLGRDPGRFVVVPYLRRLGIDRLDWVVVTHADTDHLGGLFAVVESMRPRHFVYDAREPEESLARLRRRAAQAGARLRPVDEALRYRFGGVTVDLVRPQVDSRAQNDASLVARLGYARAAVLLSGDVERAAERWLVDHEPVRASVLKVPHHGSKTSSSPRFLDAVRPEVAVVSAGKFSRFGHPHAQVMARYRRREIEVFETAVDGLVQVEIGADGVIEVRVVGR